MEEFNYKEKQIYLGASDIAQVHLIAFCRNSERVEARFINFGSDGDYAAWVIKEGDPVPAHYKEVVDLSDAAWVSVYDDERVTAKIRGGARFYRAGEFGCLIVLSSGAEIKSCGHNWYA